MSLPDLFLPQLMRGLVGSGLLPVPRLQDNHSFKYEMATLAQCEKNWFFIANGEQELQQQPVLQLQESIRRHCRPQPVSVLWSYGLHDVILNLAYSIECQLALLSKGTSGNM